MAVSVSLSALAGPFFVLLSLAMETTCHSVLQSPKKVLVAAPLSGRGSMALIRVWQMSGL